MLVACALLSHGLVAVVVVVGGVVVGGVGVDVVLHHMYILFGAAAILSEVGPLNLHERKGSAVTSTWAEQVPQVGLPAGKPPMNWTLAMVRRLRGNFFQALS